MKKKYLFIEFTLIFFFLVLPPLFITSATPFGNNSGSFSLTTLAEQLFISIILTVQFYKLIREDSMKNSKFTFSKPFLILSKVTITLGLLLVIYAITETVSFFIQNFLKSHVYRSIQNPNSIPGWIQFVTGIFISAFYEESLYRQFMPEVSIFLVNKTKLKTVIEVIWILIFAFSHLYLGIPAVFNAFCCGLVLRKCFKATGNILAVTIAHFSYNLILVIFYFL